LYASVVMWNEGKVMVKCECTVSTVCIFFINCSCNCICCSFNCICIVFIVCSVSFIVCVVLCDVFCLRVVCYLV
jgi:hypothetical protein